MTEPVYDQLAVAVQEIRARLGDAVLADRRRLSSLLFDTAPEAKREIRVIGTAIDEGVPAALKGAERHLLGLEMDRQANRLESTTGLRLDLALQIVRVLAYAMDLGPLPSVYQKSEPAGGQDPSVGAWAGMSQPVAQPAAYSPPTYAHPAYSAPVQAPAGAAPGAGAGVAGFLDRLPFDRKYLFIGAPVIVALVLALQFFGSGAKGPVVGPGGQQTPANGPAADAAGYAGELTDHGVAAKSTLESNVGTPTPMSIPVGKRITTAEVQKLLADDRSTLLVDVLGDNHTTTLQGAVFLPLAGYPGTTSDGVQSQVVAQLKTAVGGQTGRPLVFFCMGPICWESYNAVLRAHAAGYRNVYWYRGGLASWQAAGLPMQPLGPAPATTNALLN